MARPPTLRCARCGYDLGGLADAWRDRCPLEGTCSECGLTFAWRDVLNAKYRLVRGFFEHGRGLSPWRFVRTLASAFWPWRLWTRVGIESRMVPARCTLFLLLVLMLSYALFAAGSAGLAAWYWAPWWGSVSRVDVAVRALARPDRFLGEFGIVWPGGATIDVLIGAVTVVLIVPMSYSLLPTTMRRAKVRRAHRVRIATYALAGSFFCLAVWLLARAWYVGSYTWSMYWWIGMTGRAMFCLAPPLVLYSAHWWVATPRYLRLEHPRPVALSMLAIGWLAGALAGTCSTIIRTAIVMG
ncbi:MAG: hypothetical protein R3B49_07525 [Phycisphaerales bacterium]